MCIIGQKSQFQSPTPVSGTLQVINKLLIEGIADVNLLHLLSYLILTASLLLKYYCFHLREGETKTQRGEMIFLKLINSQKGK